MEIFNKYGALTFDSPLYNDVAVVEDAICHLLDKAKEMGASVVEIRALGQFLETTIGCGVAEIVLHHAVDLKRKKKAQ